MKNIISKLISRFNLVVLDKGELQAYQLSVENKALLEKKVELWYKMYKGENFAKFFGLNEEANTKVTV